MQISYVSTLAPARQGRLWRWSLLAFCAAAPRLYLLAHYNVELSEDGYDAVSTLRIIQQNGLGAVPTDLINRFLLHPLYMLFLGALRAITPPQADFFPIGRLFSVVVACAVAILIYEFTRRAYGEPAAWLAALLLMFVPTTLYEGISVLSSTLFLALYLATLLALFEERYHVAASLAFLAALTRYEGVALLALVGIVLMVRDVRHRHFSRGAWLVMLGLGCAFPLTLILVGILTSGNPLEAIAANEMAGVWLHTLAPAEFAGRALYFITGYPRLLPELAIWIGLAGALVTVIWHRGRATWILFLAAGLFVLFYETLVWFELTTLEERFLIYAALPFLIFGAAGLAGAWRFLARKLPARWPRSALAALPIAVILIIILVQSYQKGDAGMQWLYNNHASQGEVVDQLVRFVPAEQPARMTIYAGYSGPLDYFARQRNLDLVFSFFRFLPPDHPEQALLDLGVQYVLYPVGNPFAKAKFPYLDRPVLQTHGPVTFVPLAQFTTALNGQAYTFWSVSRVP